MRILINFKSKLFKIRKRPTQFFFIQLEPLEAPWEDVNFGCGDVLDPDTVVVAVQSVEAEALVGFLELDADAEESFEQGAATEREDLQGVFEDGLAQVPVAVEGVGEGSSEASDEDLPQRRVLAEPRQRGA